MHCASITKKHIKSHFFSCRTAMGCEYGSMKRKISLIGAGSVVFAKTLVSDILQSPELSGCTICLMDINPSRLNLAKAMSEKMVVKLKAKVKIEATLSQREACRNANYVICTVQVGGYKPGTVIDFEIPRKYGLLQTIGDTLGVGGIFRALRTIPAINSIAKDIATAGAPGCLLLNYTNPMAMNCWAVARAVGIPHVGLCHSVQGTSKQLAAYAGLPYEDITYRVAGINHMAFFLKFEYRGQDAYPLLFKLLEDPKFTRDRVRFEMMRRTGFFVTESSEHQSEYVPYFIHHGRDVIKRFDVPIDEYLRRCKSILATWKSAETNLMGKGGEIQVNSPSHEYGSQIIRAMETDQPTVIYGNVPNTGLIANLPRGCCVEVPCLVNAMGIQPTAVGALPPQLAALCQTNINVQSLAVEAALTRKREHIYHAVMLDPHTATVLPLDKIWAMCDDLIAAHQKVGLLGEFAPVIRGTGRAWTGTGDRVVATLKAAPPSRGDEVSSRFPLVVEVSNPGNQNVRVPLRISAGEEGVIARELGFSVSVPAKKTVVKPLCLRRLVWNKAFQLHLESTDDGVFTKGLGVAGHGVLDATEAPVSFAAELSGFPAAEGQIGRRHGRISLHLRVYDSKIAPHNPPSHTWEGSVVELFFARNDTAPIRQFFLLPQKQGSVARLYMIDNQQSRAVKGVRARQRKDGTSYDLDLELPLEMAGLRAADESFLFDAYFRLTALGDAHSGGTAPLNGRLDSDIRSEHFSCILVRKLE